MAEMGKPDRELQATMPVGSWMEVTLAQKKWFFFREVVGKIQVICVSPTRRSSPDSRPSPCAMAKCRNS